MEPSGLTARHTREPLARCILTGSTHPVPFQSLPHPPPSWPCRSFLVDRHDVQAAQVPALTWGVLAFNEPEAGKPGGVRLGRSCSDERRRIRAGIASSFA